MSSTPRDLGNAETTRISIGTILVTKGQILSRNNMYFDWDHITSKKKREFVLEFVQMLAVWQPFYSVSLLLQWVLGTAHREENTTVYSSSPSIRSVNLKRYHRSDLFSRAYGRGSVEATGNVAEDPVTGNHYGRIDDGPHLHRQTDVLSLARNRSIWG